MNTFATCLSVTGLAIAIAAAGSLSGCDRYRATFGNTKVNEITVYGNVRCVMPVADSGGLAISCDLDHPVGGVPR